MNRRKFFLASLLAPVAQLVEHALRKAGVGSSILSGGSTSIDRPKLSRDEFEDVYMRAFEESMRIRPIPTTNSRKVLALACKLRGLGPISQFLDS